MVVRHARAADLALIGPIEDAGAPMFREHFGPAMNPVLESPAASGRERAAKDGFLLVADGSDQGPVVGFVHVLVIDGHAHLEQVSVLPEVQGRGIGTELVRAAMAEARAQGFGRLSLCTYRDVPWNGPFYARLGFVEVPEADLAPYERRLHEYERSIGLDDDGVRIVMCIAL